MTRAVEEIVALVVLVVILTNLRKIILTILFLMPLALGALIGAVVASIKYGSENLLTGIVVGALCGLGAIVFIYTNDPPSAALDDQRNSTSTGQM